ncbi:kinase-like domain-containing protein [Mycena crocata]|nr:kinase-like domain-containing protein [Mycena crocata]
MLIAPALDLVLKINPVPGLSFAFALFTFIVTTVNEVQTSKTQLEVLATAIGQLLATLNAEFRAERLSTASCSRPLKDLKILLEDVHRFVEKEQGRGFVQALWNKDACLTTIEGFYRRIEITVSAFQITALLNVKSMLQNDQKAKGKDTDDLNTRLTALQHSHRDLRRTLDINQSNMIALMVSIQRKLDAQETSKSLENKFLHHTLQYLASMSGRQVTVGDWMISSFEVEFTDLIGEGGFGKVYKGTWNRTEVAVTVVRGSTGATPDISILRKEIDIWLTLRHPNILQFLGANTLDEKPFIVMPYIPENARQFLQKRPDFDPIQVLRDASLGLTYLHSRKICHGDLKGLNILVDASGRSMLCDFGLARVKADITTRSGLKEPQSMPGSRNWMAPEVMTGSPPRMASDVYAFAMTLYELYTDDIPLATVAYGDFIELVVRSSVRPQRPGSDECPRMDDALWHLAERCWLGDPSSRPSATRVYDTISQIISAPPQPRTIYSVVEERDSHPNLSELAGTTNIKSVSRPKSCDGTTSVATDDLQQRKESQAALLRKLQRTLGNNDPDTLAAMHDLACTYYQLGRPESAEELQIEVMNRRKKILGPDHSDTLTAMHNLTFTYRRLQRLPEALALGVAVTEKRKHILGAEHPNTLGAMHNLALTYYDLRSLREAAELQEFVLNQQKRVLGREHPDTLTTMYNLAQTYHDLGRFRDAEDVLVSVYERRKRVLGKGHPSTLLTMEKLVETYERQGRSKRAKARATTTEGGSKASLLLS